MVTASRFLQGRNAKPSHGSNRGDAEVMRCNDASYDLALDNIVARGPHRPVVKIGEFG